MRRLLWLLLLFPCALRAQTVGPGFINYVNSAPSGSCSQGEAQRNVIGLGTIYSCQSGTWTQVGSAAAGTVTTSGSPASGQVATFSGAATITGSTLFTFSGSTLTIGGASNAGVIALGGSTSGTATCTAPAVAGTSTNPITCSNVLAVPFSGVATNAAYGFTGVAADAGMLNYNGSFGIGTAIDSQSGTTIYFTIGQAGADVLSIAEIQPNSDAAQALGDTAKRFTNAFFSGTVNSPTFGIPATAGTNAAGSSTTLAGGLGTGNAAPGPVFNDGGTKSTTSGSTAQTQVHRQVVNDTKTLSTTTATATNILSLNVANDNSAGVVVRYTIIAKSATDTCTASGVVTAVAETNSGGTSKSAVNAATGIGQATICTGADTLAATFAITAANPAVLSVTPSWVTITPTSVYIIYNYDDLSDASTTI